MTDVFSGMFLGKQVKAMQTFFRHNNSDIISSSSADRKGDVTVDHNADHTPAVDPRLADPKGNVTLLPTLIGLN